MYCFYRSMKKVKFNKRVKVIYLEEVPIESNICWQQVARDKMRFKRRILEVEELLLQLYFNLSSPGVEGSISVTSTCQIYRNYQIYSRFLRDFSGFLQFCSRFGRFLRIFPDFSGFYCICYI